jgi:hypothetical protein
MKSKTLNLLLLILTLSLFANCEDSNKYKSELNIRVSNVSQFNLENIQIIVSTESEKINIEKINSGQMTEYIVFEKAKLSPQIELQIEGKNFTINESLAISTDMINGGGNYTYQIDANDSQEQYEKLNFLLVQE